MKSLLIGLCLIACALPSAADTMTEMHDCIQDCLASYDDLSWNFYLCVRDCLESWEAQKGDVNLTVGEHSSGYGRLYGIPILHIAAGEEVTVVFDIAGDDPLLSIDLYLNHEGPLPPAPGFGELVGSDFDPADGWAITFDSGPFDDFGGLLVARAHFAGHDEEIDGDQAVIFIATSLPPDLPEMELLDYSAVALTLSGNDGVVTGNLEYGVAVGADFSPSVVMEVAVELNGTVIYSADIATEVLAGSFACYLGPAPPCNGRCPVGECKLIRVEVDDILIDVCACDFWASWSFDIPAAPGDLVLVRLDAGNAAAEAVETNNVVSARVPVATGAVDVPGRLITGVANHPNPFNPRTVVTFILAATADVRVEIVDSRGRRVREIAMGRRPAGMHEQEWDGCDDAGRSLPSGVYRYRIVTGGEIATGVMALIR